VRPIALLFLLAACTRHVPDEPAATGDTTGDVQADLAEAPTPDAGAAASPDLAEPAAPPDLAEPKPAKRVLPFSWQGEQQYYMCGPSATRMALSTQMAQPPGQDELGNYMGTSTNGTDDISLVRGALNHYLGTSAFQITYLANDPPSQQQQDALKQALVASIDAGFGLVANIVAGWRPPFYPQSGTIYHYIALVGYDDSGDKVLVADPAATGCGDGACGDPSSSFYNVPQSYWIATKDLGEWIVPKGYAYHP
jgi:hypothetical protein